MPDYSSEEIRKWKSIIYGPDTGSCDNSTTIGSYCGNNKVDSWVREGDETLKPRKQKKSWSNGGTPKSPSSPHINKKWLGASNIAYKGSTTKSVLKYFEGGGSAHDSKHSNYLMMNESNHSRRERKTDEDTGLISEDFTTY